MPPKKKAPKAAKKKDAGPKAPIGRPRKNLGTRVSDLPLVSTLKPTSRRVNIDSLAMNRARLAYKRDYGKTLDERQSRALLDVMATTKRGPIGADVVGTFKRASDAKTTPGYTEHEGFINYYKQALKAAKKTPGQVVTMKRKKDGSYEFEIPGIPGLSGSLDTTTVPAPSAASAASEAELRSAGDRLLAKNAKLTDLINSGTLSADALVDARKKLKANTANLDSVAKGIATGVSPMDDRDLLAQERGRERLRALDQSLPQEQRDAAAARVRQITRQLTNFDRARPTFTINAAEADIIQAGLDAETISTARAKLRKAAPAEGGPDEAPVLRLRRPKPGPEQPAVSADEIAATRAALRAAPEVVEAMEEAAPEVPLKRKPRGQPRGMDIGQNEIAAAAARLRNRAEAAELVRQSAAPAGPVTQRDLAAYITDPDVLAMASNYLRSKTGPSPAFGPGPSGRRVPIEQINEAVSAIVEQVQENAPAKRAPSARAKANMQKIAKEHDIKKVREAVSARLARSRAEAEALENAPGRTREQIALEQLDRDVAEREAIAQSARDDGARIIAQAQQVNAPQKRASLLTQLREAKARRAREGPVDQEFEEEDAFATRRAMINQAVEDEIEATRIRERERQEQELRDQEIEFQNLAELAVQGDQTVSVPSRYRRARRIVRDNYLDDEFEAEDVDEEDYEDLVRRNKAATTIQDSIRSALSRSKLEKQKDASIVLQDAIRRALARNVIPDARRDRQAEADDDFNRLVQEDLDPGPVLISPRRPSNQDAFNRALARSGNIVVPGSSTRQNNRQAPPTKVYGPEAEERVARKVMNYAIDRAGTETAVTAANRYIDPAALQSQLGRLRRVVPVQDLTQARVVEVRENPARVQEESMFDDFYENLNAKLAAIRKAKGPYVPDEDWGELDPVKIGDGLVGGGFIGGVIRRLRGMGYFDGYDSLMYNIHGKPDDNKKDLADAKAAYAARGGRMNDDRTDFRVLMDAMKTLPKPTGGAIGGSIVLSGVPAPMTGGGSPVLYEITFPVKDWKTSSSLRWLRSNGIKPMKKAMQSGSVYKYAIASSKGLKDPYTSDLVSRGRKIHMTYGMA
jgi:hypothetical protein